MKLSKKEYNLLRTIKIDNYLISNEYKSLLDKSLIKYNRPNYEITVIGEKLIKEYEKEWSLSILNKLNNDSIKYLLKTKENGMMWSKFPYKVYNELSQEFLINEYYTHNRIEAAIELSWKGKMIVDYIREYNINKILDK